MRKRWNYSGDIRLEYGGYFWREDGADDYVLAVDVLPCSCAGGPDNLYWITEGSVYLPSDDRRKEALSCCGWTEADLALAKPKARRDMLVAAFMSYGGVDRDGHTIVQIGRAPGMHGREWDPADMKPDVILRAGSSLRNYVKREHLLR